MKTIIIIFFFCLISSLVSGETTNLPLRGQGNYKWLFLKIYEVKLWGEKAEDLYSRPLVLELKYNRSLKGKDIAAQSVKELVNAGNSKIEMEQWMPKLLEIFPDVKKGDTIQADYNPENGVTFHLNSSKELGRLTDLSFSKKFLDIWLGEKTSDPELRNQLLGRKI
jgi:hypothetical protein